MAPGQCPQIADMRKLLITSIPKAGTHLFTKVVELATGMQATAVRKSHLEDTGDIGDVGDIETTPVLYGHLRLPNILGHPALESACRTRSIFVLIRDPRDVCLSMLHHVLTHRSPIYEPARRALVDLPFDARIRRIAEGIRHETSSFRVARLDEHCGGFIDLVDAGFMCSIIRYEDFFDASTLAPQLCGPLGRDAGEVCLAIEAAVGATTRTLRRGKPFGWRDDFDDALKLYFRTRFGDVIEQLGYSP